MLILILEEILQGADSEVVVSARRFFSGRPFKSSETGSIFDGCRFTLAESAEFQ